MIIATPVLLMASWFMRSFEEMQEDASGRVFRMFRDFAVRATLLGVVIFLLVKAFQVGILWKTMAGWMLLAAAGSLSGELAAMVLYFVRRRSVLSTTNALLRVGSS